MNKKRPRLQKELLFNLSLLTAAAVLVAVASALVSQLVTPRRAAVVLSFLIVADIAVVAIIGRYLINKLVLQPLHDLNQTTTRIAAGNLDAPAPEASTAEFTELANKFNHMTSALRGAGALFGSIPGGWSRLCSGWSARRALDGGEWLLCRTRNMSAHSAIDRPCRFGVSTVSAAFRK